MERCTLVYPVRGDSILLSRSKRGVAKGKYDGWGGKSKRDDAMMVVTALREFTEETGGATFNIPDLGEPVAVIDFYEAGIHLYQCYAYFLSKWEGEIRETDEKGPPVEFSVSALPFEEMMPGDRRWLPVVLRGEKIKAEIYYNAGKTQVLRSHWRLFTQRAAPR